MKTLFLVLTLTVFHCFICNSQSSELEDCWQCILAAEQKNDDKVIEECGGFLKNYPSNKSSQVAKLLLGSAYLKKANYSEAIELLNKIQSKNGMLNAMTRILIGDAYSELGKTEEAIHFYEEAAKIDINNLTTTLALYKAMVNVISLNEDERVQGYVQTIKDRFSAYYSSNKLEKYLDRTTAFKAFDLPEKPNFEQPEELGYGTIYGKKVDINRFLEEVDYAYSYLNEYEEREDTYHMYKIHEIFNWYAKKLIQNKECGELGLRVSDVELEAYLLGEKGFDVLPDLRQGFVDEETGEFDKERLKLRIEEMRLHDDESVREMWAASKKYYTTRRLHEKLASIYAYGGYVTQMEVELAMKENSEVKRIQYILFPYYNSDDSDKSEEPILVSNEELDSYYDEYKEKPGYQSNRDSRKIAYFQFFKIPSKEDSLIIEKELMELKKAFKVTKEDSSFVIQNSDIKAFCSTHLATFKSEDDPTSRQGMTYPSNLKQEFSKAKIGDVIGPYVDGKNYRIAKVLDFNKNTLTVRHLLVAASRYDQKALYKAQLKVDKLMKEINHDNFSDLVAKYSEDPGSNKKGGVYTDFLDYEMVPEFSKFAVEEEIGKIGYVQTDFGFHIMEVLDRKRVDLPVLAIISKEIKTSDKSNKDLLKDVVMFKTELEGKINKAPTSELYNIITEVAEETNRFPLSFNFNDDSPSIYGFDSINSINLLKFVYNQSVQPGDVGEPLFEEDRIVLPVFKGVFKKGTQPIYESEYKMKQDIIEQKRTLKFREKINHELDLNEIADNENLTVIDAEIRLSENGLSGKRYEPEMIGAIFRENKLNEQMIFEGHSGIYVLKEIDNFIDEGLNSKIEMKNNLQKNREEFLSSHLVNALEQKADIINNSILFHFGIRR